MNNICEEAKKQLEAAGINSETIKTMINIFVKPDNMQELSEENFRLKEENTRLAYQCEDFKNKTLELIEQIEIFLNTLSRLDIEEESSISEFIEIQRKAKEICKIFSLMKMLYR